MYLTKFDPFESLTALQGEVDRMFNRHLSGAKSNETKRQTDWLPAVDIHEDAEAYHFDVEAPGIEKDQFDISVENNTLSIRGKRESHSEEKRKNFFRIERDYGSFARSFSLPDTADVERVNAEYKNGVLHVKVAKKELLKPKKISVQAS